MNPWTGLTTCISESGSRSWLMVKISTEDPEEEDEELLSSSSFASASISTSNSSMITGVSGKSLTTIDTFTSGWVVT